MLVECDWRIFNFVCAMYSLMHIILGHVELVNAFLNLTAITKKCSIGMLLNSLPGMLTFDRLLKHY